MRNVADIFETEVIGLEVASLFRPVVDEVCATALVTTDGTDNGRTILNEEVECSLLELIVTLSCNAGVVAVTYEVYAVGLCLRIICIYSLCCAMRSQHRLEFVEPVRHTLDGLHYRCSVAMLTAIGIEQVVTIATFSCIGAIRGLSCTQVPCLAYSPSSEVTIFKAGINNSTSDVATILLHSVYRLLHIVCHVGSVGVSVGFVNQVAHGTRNSSIGDFVIAVTINYNSDIVCSLTCCVELDNLKIGFIDLFAYHCLEVCVRILRSFPCTIVSQVEIIKVNAIGVFLRCRSDCGGFSFSFCL